MPDKILDEIIDEHLPYEIDMVRSTYRQLSSVARTPQGSETREQQVARHALIESFCIHARSLMDFFGNRSNDPTDSIAGEFTDGFATPIDLSKEPLKTLRIKLNKQVFHLTKNRTLLVTEKFDPGKDGTLFLQLIEPAIVHFNACLKPEFSRFKCNTEPVVFVIKHAARFRYLYRFNHFCKFGTLWTAWTKFLKHKESNACRTTSASDILSLRLAGRSYSPWRAAFGVALAR